MKANMVKVNTCSPFSFYSGINNIPRSYFASTAERRKKKSRPKKQENKLLSVKKKNNLKKILNFLGSPKDALNSDLNSLIYTLIIMFFSVRAVCDEFCGL